MTSSSSPRVLVTGASGMLGSHIVDRLSALGADVLATDLAAPARGFGWDAAGVDFHEADITDDGLGPLIGEVDRIVHVAAMLPSPAGGRERSLFDVNVAATHRLFEEASRLDRKVVFASSGSVYGASRPAQDGVPASAFVEDDRSEELDFYGLSKHVGELYADAFGRSRGLSWNALRCGVLYGPRLRMGLSTRFLLSVLDDIDAGRRPVVDGDPDGGLDWIDVDAAAECFAEAVLRDIPAGPLNVSTGVATRLEDVLDLLVEIAGGSERIEWSGAAPTGRYSGARYYDPSLTRERLGVELATDLPTGLRRLVAWRRGVRRQEPDPASR